MTELLKVTIFVRMNIEYIYIYSIVNYDEYVAVLCGCLCNWQLR